MQHVGASDSHSCCSHFGTGHAATDSPGACPLAGMLEASQPEGKGKFAGKRHNMKKWVSLLGSLTTCEVGKFAGKHRNDKLGRFADKHDTLQ